ncbi:MAG: phosphatase [Oscillospiraceae bacterium]
MYIEVDTHCHTIASTHAYSTVLEMANSAAEIGLKGLAITDHSTGGADSPHIWHFHNMIKAIPRVLKNVNMIFGAEVNIMDFEGNLDFNETELKKLEWIVASMHGTIMKIGTSEDYTNSYIKLAKNPYVDAIGHCAMNNFKFDYEKVLKIFKEYEKFVEINESAINNKAMAKENYIEIVNICKKYEIPVVVNTDAHFCYAVGDVSSSEKLLTELDFPKKLVLNANWDSFKEYIVKKRGNIFE